MKYKVIFFFLVLFASFLNPAFADEKPQIEFFSPQGTVKKIRQVTAKFSEQMVPFGDPSIVDPFDIKCPEKGKGRWVDGKTWSYDFERDLPAGIICEFNLKSDAKTLAGKKIEGQRAFSFSTGGPAVIRSAPREGNNYIDENQAFLLYLDAEPSEDTILKNAYCSIEGINEQVGVRLLKGSERDDVLKVVDWKLYLLKIKKHRAEVADVKDFKEVQENIVILQCKQTFPAESTVKIVWGKGIESKSGVAIEQDQILPFKTRGPFNASFNCERENKDANCIPMLPMRVYFSSPVSRKYADRIQMKGSDNKIYKPKKIKETEDEAEASEEKEPEFINSLIFDGPFPENSSFTIEIPKEIRDDAGRALLNIDKFPLTVRTDSYPPLAKFSGRFGIIELKGDAVLPVTLRNLEPQVKTRMLKADEKKKGAVEETIISIIPESVKEKGKQVVEGLKGMVYKVPGSKEEAIIEWLRRVAGAGRKRSILKNEGEKEFSIPKPGGAKAFDVVGIPLKSAGLYVVELESDILGASLSGKQGPMYVSTAALVTNLSAHFKWGRESSLVWVTTLDKAEPIAEASITIMNCKGERLWEGKTDAKGIAHIKENVSLKKQMPYCQPDRRLLSSVMGDYDYSEPGNLGSIYSGVFIFAKTKDDMTFVHSAWSNGIEPWRYQLPSASYKGPVIAHTILDRTLLKAGEVVSMKHVIRKHTMSGFLAINDADLPKAVLISHQGSGQRYEFPLMWDAKGIAESRWEIPKNAKLGTYQVTLLKKETDKAKERTTIGGYEAGDEGYFRADGWQSGSFRVEEFRVPLMKGIIQPPKEPLINAKEAEIDLLLTYLSGGGVGNASVKLRYQVQPKPVRFEDYEGFTLSNGAIKEGIQKGRSYYGHDEEDGERTEQKQKIQGMDLILDKTGALRTRIKDLPKITLPQDILTEMEFRDPNGEIQTVSGRMPLWPSRLLIGIKPDSWAASKEAFKFHVIALNLSGKPAANTNIKVDLFQRKHYSHRKRVVGGFYSYEHVTETKRIGHLCEGRTDAKGLLICDVKSPVSGNVIIQAQAADDKGNISTANRDVWIAGKGEWWFDVSDNDRIDLLPEKKRYEPGDTARFQVRMPFREATALISVEREGIIETSVKKLSGKSPTIDIPIKGNYAPNVFVSALVVRGRVSGIQPTALVDLGRPAFKLGIAEINVGWKEHELKVQVMPEKDVYKVREKAMVKIKVKAANGNLPPKGSEVSVAAVDEGLLELMPNKSWELLQAMMGRRGYEVATSTAQMHVVGKRHYGLKALPHGGGGGRKTTRDLFDTLLLWKGRVALNDKGEADVEIPLNDSLTGFRIVAVASGGNGLFGTGDASIRTTQDLMLLSGLPHVVREGDRFRAGFTIRNTSKHKMDVEVRADTNNLEIKSLPSISETISAGEAKDIGWEITVPYNIESLAWDVTLREKGGSAGDRMKIEQKVAEAVPVRVFQATIAQVEKSISMKIERPKDAVIGKGGVTVSLRAKLTNGLGGVTWYMNRYPYTCMEQKVSRAVALKDAALWKKVIDELPSHLDSDGLVKYFPSFFLSGSDILTSYILSISDEAGFEMPDYIKNRMETGLRGFAEGRVIRYSSLPTADLAIRKIAAIEALSRSGKAEPKLLSSITIDPNLWPTSAVIDWMNILIRVAAITERENRLKEAEHIIRSRLNLQGTTMGFSTEVSDNLWWLMVSPDVNAVRTVLTFLEMEKWKEDMPRIVRGAIGRQHRGAWNTTTANAWGVLAVEKFSEKFENIPVAGTTASALAEQKKAIDWNNSPEGSGLMFAWPKGKDDLKISHQGTGKPWATIQSLAAIPLKEPFSSGYKIKKNITPVEQKQKGKWSKGDVARVRLELEAQADMTWVVVNDPVPAGSSILGTGLGRDSQIMTKGEKSEGWVWPAFEERSFEAFRLYYEFVPKGKWAIEYTIRLNNEGIFLLPPTRAEALYAPEMLGETPNVKVEVIP